MERKEDSVPSRVTAPNPDEAPSVGIGSLLGRLLVYLIVASAIWAAILYLKPGLVVTVLAGLSFVIFIHELGHFAVAKWCDVHVTHFSIGFGPKVPGLWFKAGETTYQFCLIPLGGYVQMVGQVDGDESADGSEDDPRSYRNKSVFQRMAIISAGVIMNAILALVCFIIIYRGPGKDRLAPVVAFVDAGGPGFVEGLRTGAVIEQIGSIENPYFDDLKMIVAGSSWGEKVTFVGRRPGDAAPLKLSIEPRKTKTDSNPVIGIAPPQSAKLAGKRETTLPAPAWPNSPASKATPALEFADVVVGTSDPANPSTVAALPEDPRKPGQRDYFELLRRMQLLADQEIVLRMQRTTGDKTEEVDVRIPPTYRWSIGAVMEIGRIVAIRKESPAARAGVRGPDPIKNLKADRIRKVVVAEADGSDKTFEGSTLDPDRLPFDLRQWAQRRSKAGSKAKADAPVEVALHLQRHREGAGAEFEDIVVKLPWDYDWTFDRMAAMSVNSPVAIPELGLAYSISTTVASADPKGPLKAGDTVKAVRVVTVGLDGKEDTPKWPKETLAEDQWPAVSKDFSHSGVIAKVALKITRDKKEEEVEIVPTQDTTWALVDRGILFAQDTRRQHASTTLEAVSHGVRDTHKSMLQIVGGLRGMFTGRIDWKKNLGGPISIANIAYGAASYDVWEFLYFMGLISINLAVINFLPIPVLDGGHMVFLLYEKIRGKPASDTVRGVATWAGLAFLLGLMGLVIYLDIGRFFFN